MAEDICLCFGPPVEDCPVHGWRARRKVAHADYLQRREDNPGEAAKNDQAWIEYIKSLPKVEIECVGYFFSECVSDE
jgi:hypothetical protein